MPLTGPSVARVRLEKASWDEVRRITDKYLPRWIRTIVDAFEKARAGTSMRALIRLLEGEEFDKVVDEIDWISIDGPQAEGARAVFPILLRDVMESTADTAVGILERSPKIRVVGAFDVTNPRATEWIRQHSAELVTQISVESKQAIRDLVARAYTEGIPAQTLGRMIRSSIGLTTRQARAVANMRARMIADGKKADQIEKVTERYAARLLRRRAEMIARTELIKAETQGQLELWRQQAEAGNIDRNLAGVRWIVTPDDRLCPECEPLDEVVVGLGETFPGGVEGSPLHPNCRCTVALVPEWRKLRLVA
jgi:SPP1 gp7 family putative phage head morphogenesis protein